MARNGSDDATRPGTTPVEAVEGLLAYAQSRWGGGGIKRAYEAVALSRAMAERDPGTYGVLLARCLRTTATLLLRRGQATEALPMAQEAVALTRAAGGAPLAVSLYCLVEALEALSRFSEAAAFSAEADRLDPG
ncbi:hypothetical protein AB0L05_33690 [Nonomuraea pusilla]|uniref:hypothetical protein n=1 Tax=Nonomuraea pusilla TaxID=46177 RepID=UPI00331D4B02